MILYQKPPEVRDGLGLHQNENIRGCSPRVIEALRKLRSEQVGQYLPSSGETGAVAEHFNVPVENVCLTNALSEGIIALSIAQLRSTTVAGVDDAGIADALHATKAAVTPLPSSAKGATSNSSPGQRPRASGNTTTSAESALQSLASSNSCWTVNRAFSADALGFRESWGVAPGSGMNAAPSALNTCAFGLEAHARSVEVRIHA